MKNTFLACISVILFHSVLIVIVSPVCGAQTIVPAGPVSGLWDTTGSPYLVQGDITVPDESTLTIDPGVLVEFQGHYGLDVKGQLLAVGTHTDTIIFTVNDTTGFHDSDTTLGGWYGIRLIDVPLHNDTTRLEYCRIEYGKAAEGDWFLNAGGGMCILHFGKVVISNSVFTNCSAGGPNEAVGGALAVAWSDIQIYNSVFSHNRADRGGAMHFYESNPVLAGNTIENNHARFGGGLDLQTKSRFELRENIIKNNVAEENGGGVIIGEDSVFVTFNRDTLTGNYALNGGAVYAANCEVSFDQCYIARNGAGLFGGGVDAYVSPMVFSGCTFEDDTSGHAGGALRLNHSRHRIDGCTFRDNTAKDDAGAIFIETGTTRIDNSSFTGNYAVWGGALNSGTSDVQILNSSFSQNNSEHGGVLNTWRDTIRLISTSFMENTAIWGGVMSARNSSVEIDSCTFSGNIAQSEGGAFEFWADTAGFTDPYVLEMKNSLFEENESVNRSGAMLIEQTGTTDMLIDLLVDRCDFINNTANIVGVSRIAGLPDFRINNSRFIGNTGTQRTAGLALGTPNGNITNCLFLDHRNSSGAAPGVGMLAFSKADFMNCTFVNRADSGLNGISMRQGVTVSVVNSIFWGEGQRQFTLVAVTDSTPCTLYINHCDVQYGTDSIDIRDTVSVVHWGAGNLSEDPQFLDSLNGDFRLQGTSPCIGAGVDSIEVSGIWAYAPETDIDGTPRPNPPGTMPDMGAYESQYPITGVENGQQVPSSHALHQNYPNPFNPVTIISYDLPEGSMVSLRVYDLLGRQITTLVDAFQPAGVKKVEFDGRNLPSGVYVYTLQAGDFNAVRKLLLIR